MQTSTSAACMLSCSLWQLAQRHGVRLKGSRIDRSGLSALHRVGTRSSACCVCTGTTPIYTTMLLHSDWSDLYVFIIHFPARLNMFLIFYGTNFHTRSRKTDSKHVTADMVRFSVKLWDVGEKKFSKVYPLSNYISSANFDNLLFFWVLLTLPVRKRDSLHTEDTRIKKRISPACPPSPGFLFNTEMDLGFYYRC